MSLRVVKKTCVDVCFLVQGMLENNVYFISDGEATMVVDPSSDAEEIMRALDGRELDAIVLTHCHSDHVGAAADLRRLTVATVIASKIDAPEICGEKPISRDNWKFKTCPVDFRAEDGDVVEIGNMAWKVMITPGHTKGGMCWYLVPQFGNHEDGAPVLISGDTLFEGSVGRTSFPDTAGRPPLAPSGAAPSRSGRKNPPIAPLRGFLISSAAIRANRVGYSVKNTLNSGRLSVSATSSRGSRSSGQFA